MKIYMVSLLHRATIKKLLTILLDPWTDTVQYCRLTFVILLMPSYLNYSWHKTCFTNSHHQMQWYHMLQIFYAEKQLCFKPEVKHIIHIITIKTQKQLVRGTRAQQSINLRLLPVWQNAHQRIHNKRIHNNLSISSRVLVPSICLYRAFA